jgi:hypothetical protein
MLRFAQHDKTEDVIPSVSEESSTWMLRCAQHDRGSGVRLKMKRASGTRLFPDSFMK